MGWKPGLPVATEADARDWEAWKRQAARERQRARRRTLRRIDFECSPDTVRFLEHLRSRHGAVGMSTILSAVVARWAAAWVAGAEPDLW